MVRQTGLPPSKNKPMIGAFTNLGLVGKVYPKRWRCDVRDVTHTETQPTNALVIGPVLPPEHRPADGVQSYVLYGFNGGRRREAWCIPLHHSQLTDDEREANSYFLRLLGVSVRIGKDGDDTVYEVSGGDAIIRVNITTGNVLVKGADGTARVEIEAGGKIVIVAKSGSTVEVGSLPVELATKTDVANLTTSFNTAVAIFNAHTQTVTAGVAGAPAIPMVTAGAPAGTTELKGT